MKRRPTTQDITWLLDLARNKQLDLNPPYQRRSVWTGKDRQYFLDTIFRDYPSPAIFLHKSISDDGKSMYHVVDGKQRLETILAFVDNKLKIPSTFGDIRLDGKKWKDLEGELEQKHRFWNYQISVEMVDVIDGAVVNEVFERLNRNSRKLTSQELRHAKYDGWFITTAEAEADKEDWKKLGVVTVARAKRMADTQFISELLMVVIKKSVNGFDQDQIDDFYADYDGPVDEIPSFSEEEFKTNLERAKAFILEMEKVDSVVTRFGKSLANVYTLWTVVVLHYTELNEIGPAIAAARYKAFMGRVEETPSSFLVDVTGATQIEVEQAPDELLYYEYSRGASTDASPRQERHTLLSKALLTAQ